MQLKKRLVNDQHALLRIDLQRPSRLRRWDTPPASMSLVVSRRFRPSDTEFNESNVPIARSRVRAQQVILCEHLATAPDDETRGRIQHALELSTQQLRDQTCDRARLETLLEHYRDIESRLRIVVLPRAVDYAAARRQFDVDLALALHLAKTMNLASLDVCGHGRDAREWLITLCIHAEDLRMFVHLICLGEPLTSPLYRRDSRVTGHFEPDKLFAHL